MGALVEQRRRSVGTDVSGDAWPDVGACERQVEVKVGRPQVDRRADRECERRSAEWRRVDPEQKVICLLYTSPSPRDS